MPTRGSSYREVLTQALAEFAEHGYDSQERLDYWLGRLRAAIDAEMQPQSVIDARLRQSMTLMFERLRRTGHKRYHHGLPQYVLDRVGPQLQAILERRVLVSVDLIKLNRKQSVEKTLQRFAGLATSIPPGGSRAVDKTAAKETVGKSLRQMTFEERRVVIDQGHKMVANINQTIAEDGGAIAVMWHSHWRQKGYDYREDHKERDEQVYLLRGNWAQKAGLVKLGKSGYYDKITAVAEEPFCRCYGEFLYTLDDLPREMLTKRGRAAAGG